MNDACRKTNGKAFLNTAQASVKHLKRVANTFMQLQQHRHTADYDNSKRWTRTEVLAHIELAADAFDSWKAINKKLIAEDFLLQLLIAGKNYRQES